MPTLRELQIGFVGAVLHPQRAQLFGRNLRLRALPNEQRIQIYRNNLYATLTGALEAVYPVVHKLVGAQCFAGVARRYAGDEQSGSGDIHAYGDRFPEFLSTVSTLREYPYLPDVARLEWTYHRLFHSASLSPLMPAALQDVPPARYADLRLQLQTASRLLASDYPVLHIWQVNQDDWAGDTGVRLDEGGVRLIALRGQGGVSFVPLEHGEYVLLQALSGDMTLADATAQALYVDPDLDLLATLARHLALGSFTGWRL
jgi:hypothetical protein